MAKAGDVIGGKYRLIHPLGIGGMGAVWRAEHTALMQQVAVKLLDARGPAAERAVKRFQREAQIAAGIRHRNVVYISDFGTDGGAPYLVMELLNGVPLSERIVVGEPLTVASFLSLVCETLDGLSAVHEAGVVHRDMKPENIFLVRAGDAVFPKLLDFGVSRSTNRTQGHTITREGIVMGTPEYVSPEQARGRMADTRSDLYSLGVVIYEALAGRLPFQADNAADLIVSVLNADAVPLSAYRPDLGEEISALVQRTLAKDPEQRFASCQEMRLAIEACMAARPDFAQLSLPRRYQVSRGAPTTPVTSGQELTPTARELVPTRPQWLPSPTQPGAARRLAAWGAGAAVFIGAIALLATLNANDVKTQAHAAPDAKAGTAVGGAQPVVAPKQEAEVAIELFGVPAGGQVYVDGAAVPGTTVRLARNTGMHQITPVEAAAHEPWTVMHDSAVSGRYALALQRVEPADEPVRALAGKPVRSREERARLREARAKNSKLLRTPDF